MIEPACKSRQITLASCVYFLATIHTTLSAAIGQDSTQSAATLSHTSLLQETTDGYIQLPWLTTDNLDRCTEEMKKRGITRLRLDRMGSRERPADLMRQLFKSCSQLEAVSLVDSQLTNTDLHSVLSELPRLKRLQITGCRLTQQSSVQDGEVEWESLMTRITHFTVMNCRGIDNETIGRFLTIMSRLEELGLFDSEEVPGGDFNGEGWPLAQLTRLRELSIHTPADDEFVRSILTECSSLETLKLWDCNSLTGEDWPVEALARLTTLELISCDNLSADQASEILTHTPQLESLAFHSYPDEDHGDLDVSTVVELKNLNIRGEKNRVRGIESLTSLQTLSMFGITATEERGLDFSGLTKLSELELDACGPLQLDTLPSSIETFHLGNCKAGNEEVKRLLSKLVNLRSLRLFSIYGGYGFRTDSNAVTGIDWDFGALRQLTFLEFNDCPFLSDQLVIRFVEQLDQLESLTITNAHLLTGKEWKLSDHSHLKRIDLDQLPRLTNDIVNGLPASLESLSIESCGGITGKDWDLASMSNLSQLKLAFCDNLTSMGRRLPPSLIELNVRRCRRLRASDLDYTGIDQLQSISFWECHVLDVDRLFEALPKHASSLRRLDLTACPDLRSDAWDLSPLRHTLLEIVYPEGEPSYVGGIGDANSQILQRQLPDTRFSR